MLTRPFKSQSINNLYICSLILDRSISFSSLECMCAKMNVRTFDLCKDHLEYLQALHQMSFPDTLYLLFRGIVFLPYPPAPDQIRIINALYILVSNIYQLLMISSSNE